MPDDAWLPRSVHDSLQALAQAPRIQLGIVSGRDVPDLRERVAAPEAVYAGCHGLEIQGPGIRFRHAGALAHQEAVLAISVELSLRAPGVPGMYVELKRFGVAVHYRRVAPDQVRWVESEVARAIERSGTGLTAFRGRKVIEIQPEVSWTSVDCVRWIHGAVQRGSPERVMVLYMGDHWVGENALAELPGPVLAITVGSDAAPSDAVYHLPSVDDAQRLLTALATLCLNDPERAG
jgi:trehalose-phosphatase